MHALANPRLREPRGSAPAATLNMPEAIVVEDVRKCCPNRTAGMRGVSFRVRTDEVFGRLGPHWARKSTSGTKARVQRTRGQLRDLPRHCCQVEHDRRGGIAGLQACREGRGCEMNTEIERLRELVTAFDGSDVSVERARAHAALGAAVRRAGRPLEAREPLRVAVDLAHRSGATALEAEALAELRATGARPRRRLITGAGALTDSERRVSELAAGGRKNREIAEALVVTVATVEYHLRNAYRKLGIPSRAGLREALGRSRASAAVATRPIVLETRDLLRMRVHDHINIGLV
ncbi:MAG TPA: LuxR C-terminal-related transcriptional regulator [Solirubrobacteraceae bacterium]|nr:LuxR C-terminal-related transcriptional regulator [Solirubrobacteraceae bacterium]